MYCVIVGDIIHSKALDFETREADMNAIDNILEQINTKYINSIIANFGIVRGDAFEGVLFSQQYAPSIIREIIKFFYKDRNLKVRISAVMDELSSVSLDRNKADGPAFHKAIQEIDEMKKEKSDHWFQVRIITNSIAQPLVDSLMNLLATITKNWTEKQREIVWAMSDFSKQQNLVSKKFNITAAVVNKQLKAANYEAYNTAWDSLEKYLIDVEEESIKSQKKTLSYTTYYSIGRRKNKLRDYITAVQYFIKSLELAKKEFGVYDLRLVPIYNGLAEAYLEQQANESVNETTKRTILLKAKNMIDESFLCQQGASKMRLEYALTINILGNYFLEVEKFDEALNNYIQAKKIIQDIYGSSHPLLPVCDNNIAIAYKRKKLYDEALAYYNSSMVAAKENAEQDPLNYADSLYNIGLCYEEMKQFKLALQYIEHSLNVYLSFLPSKHEYIVELREAITRLKSNL